MEMLRQNPFCLNVAIAAALFGMTATMAATPAAAQSTQMSSIQLNGDEPIKIDADNFEVNDSTKLITFSGDVVAQQGDNTVNAGKMVVRYKGGSTGLASGQGDIDRIDLSEKVRMANATQSATGDTGYVDMAKQLFVLSGAKVVLKEGNNVFVGCKLTVNMVTSEAKLDACGGRVQIQLDPSSRQAN